MDLVQRYLAENSDTLSRIGADEIDTVVAHLLGAYGRRASVFSMGNGGSASTSAQFVAELGRYATGDRPGFRAFDLSGNSSALTTWVNDCSWEEVYEMQIAGVVERDDVVVAFSVHGGQGRWSENLVRGLAAAKKSGASTIGFSGAGGGAFKEVCDISVVIPTASADLVKPITKSVHVSLVQLICTCLRSVLGGPGSGAASDIDVDDVRS